MNDVPGVRVWSALDPLASPESRARPDAARHSGVSNPSLAAVYGWENAKARAPYFTVKAAPLGWSLVGLPQLLILPITQERTSQRAPRAINSLISLGKNGTAYWARTGDPLINRPLSG